MGNVRSTCPDEEEDIWWTNGEPKNTNPVAQKQSCQNSFSVENSSEKVLGGSLNQLSERSRQEFNEFQLEFERKHEKRREILAAKKKEMGDLRQEVQRLKEENEKLKSMLTPRKEDDDGVEDLTTTAQLLDKNRELKVSIAEMQQELQNLNSVVVEFEKEREEYKAHVVALKDVISVSKKMLLIRESQLSELRQKVESIEASLSGTEMNLLSQNLRVEYERQLQSIRNLKALYEERQRSDHRQKQELQNLLEETKKELQTEQNKNKELEERIDELEESNSQKYDQIKSLESNFGLSKAESRQYQTELAVINQLFSEILLGFNNSQGIDLDKLTKHLEDHHDLLQNIVVNEISPAASAALPKVLLDLVTQVNDANTETPAADQGDKKLETIVEESESQTSSYQINSAEEIVELLPKVWRVLIELLSHQKVPTNILPEEPKDENPCYKTVQTPKGPSLVLSVSQTFIRLKDLILEKKSLEKETGHLKQLNTHLETRLQDQEKRLQMVSSELNKTWHVVGKLQKQHQLLHTQEKILRYELAQKRKLLSTLKEELEYSREKWQQAREKNSNTEKQWKQLRVEFAQRRNTVVGDDLNNSTESGFSDERCSSDDEPGYETDVSESGPKPNDVEDLDRDVVVSEDVSDSDPKTNDRDVIVSEKETQEMKRENSITDLIAEEMQSILNQQIDQPSTTADSNDLTTKSAPSNAFDHSSGVDSSNDKTEAGSSSTKTLEEVLAAREDRLKRLEGQCQQLVNQATNTTNKSVVISNRLDDLHKTYGERSGNGSSSSQDRSDSCE